MLLGSLKGKIKTTKLGTAIVQFGLPIQREKHGLRCFGRKCFISSLFIYFIMIFTPLQANSHG